MERRWVGVLLLAVSLSGGSALAQERSGSAGARPASEWHGNVSYVFGYKRLASAWAPARSQVEFGVVDIDLKRHDWPVSVVLQLLLTYQNDTPALPGFAGNNSGTYEWNVGIRRIWGEGSGFHPFLSGGLSVLGASTSTWVVFGGGDSANVQEQNDSTVGGWVSAGGFWQRDRGPLLGVSLQYSRGRVELFGHELEAGGAHVLMHIGTSW